MIIYILILILVIALSLIDSHKLNKVDIFLFIFLIGISGFRYNVGTDFPGYVYYFNLIDKGLEASVEPGFIFISELILKMGLNIQAVFLVFSILTMFFLYKGLTYYTNNEYIYKPVLYILMLIYTFFPSLNVIRQILAAVIILFASRYIINRSFIKFAFWVLIASLFHSSSLIFIILYFIALKNYRRITLIGVLIISLLVVNGGLLYKALEFIHYNLNFLDVGGYLQKYLEESSYNNTEIEFGLRFIINLLVLILFIIFKDLLVRNERTLLIFNFFYLFILSYVFAIDAYVFSRFTYFFGIFMAIAVARFGVIFDNNSRRIIEYVILILYSILYIYIIIYNPAHDIVPYDFNFDLKVKQY